MIQLNTDHDRPKCKIIIGAWIKNMIEMMETPASGFRLPHYYMTGSAGPTSHTEHARTRRESPSSMLQSLVRTRLVQTVFLGGELLVNRLEIRIDGYIFVFLFFIFNIIVKKNTVLWRVGMGV